MKCPECGYNSFGYLKACKKCGLILNPKPIYVRSVSGSRSDLFYNEDRERKESLDIPYAGSEPGFAKDTAAGQRTVFQSPKGAGGNIAAAGDESRYHWVVPDFGFERISATEESPGDGLNTASEDIDQDQEKNPYVPLHSRPADESRPGEDEIPASAGETTGGYVLHRPADYGNNENAYIENGGEKHADTRAEESELTPYNLATLSSRAIAFLIDLTAVALLAFSALLSGLYLLGEKAGIYDNLNILIILYLMLFVIASSYFVILHGFGGKTIGKMIMGIRLITYTGEPSGLLEAFTRWVGYYVSASILFFGFIWSVFDSEYQTWHDKIAGTYVIKD